VSSTHLPRQSPLLKTLVVLFILAIAVFIALPNYFNGRWAWEHPPQVVTLAQLKQLQQEGLSLPGWRTLDHQVSEIGGHKWSIQAILPETVNEPTATNPPTLLLLRPQTDVRDQPQVDWMDVNGWMNTSGVQRWTVDSRRRLRFTVERLDADASHNDLAKILQIQARFFRGWNQQQTYAVLQWYAWSDGGDPSPSRWFWADQLAQLRDRQKMPWVAVSALIPIKPLGNIESVQPLAESLGQAIQSTLIRGPLESV
jgi:cyanoexosortase B-associated protein